MVGRDFGVACLLASLLVSGCSSKNQTETPVTPTPTPTPTPTTPTPGTGGSTGDAVILTDALAGKRLFPTDNWWNQSVANAPIDSRSDAYINFIGRTRQGHPDFGPPPYGIPYMTVGGTQPRVPVTFVAYGDESDAGFGGTTGYPIPEVAKTEPNYIEGAAPGGGSDGDRHLIIVDRDRWLLFELWTANWNRSAQRWEAGSGAIFDLSSNSRRPEGWTSADAAGLPILPGLVRYDEAVAGPITHALRVTFRATDGHVWPASHSAGSTSGALPMGARLRLKSSKSLSSYPAYIQNIFRGMQTYGLIVADNGTDLYVSGAMDPRWNNEELNPAFKTLTPADFDVIQLGWR